MKKRIFDKIGAQTVVSFSAAALCALMLGVNFPLCRTAVERAAVLSARTVLVAVKEKTVTAASDPQTRQREDTPKPQDETPQTEATTEKTVAQTEAPKAESTETVFTAVPEDIRALEEKYSKNAKNDKKDGAIKELTYTNSGVTDFYENIRVKNTNDTDINIKALLERKPDITIKDKSKPAVLIFHTHTTEAYQILDRSFYARGYTTRSEDSALNMIRVGDEICAQLEKAGYKTIHDTQIYDKMYNGAYDRSRAQVKKYLEKYPDIQVVLDIHRDAIEYSDGTKIKPVKEINGRKCAQMMIISGCQEQGNGITDFEDWEYNLVFALHLQQALENAYPGITRPLYFCPRRYIMNESHSNLLIEMGSDANTLGEAVYAGKCLGTALSTLLDEYST